MFNRKSSYALNKKDPNAIVYMDANEAIIRLTREDFASEEEFLKWKSWSDGNYHTEDNQDVVEGKHNTSIDDLSEAALSIPAIDVVMDRKHEKAERHRAASAMVSQIRDKLTETQFRRLWMYYIRQSTPSRPRTFARASAFSGKNSRRFWKTGVSATAGFHSLRSSPRWKP